MKALNTVKITFPSRSVNEGFARSALSAFAAQADPTLDELGRRLRRAVSEGCNELHRARLCKHHLVRSAADGRIV